MANLLRSTVERIFSDTCGDATALGAEEGIWPDRLWDACVEAALPQALIDRGEQCLEVAVEDAFAIVRLAGRFAAPIPLPETMLANWLLARCGLEPQAGPLVVVSGSGLRLDAAQQRLTGSAAGVPWGRQAGVVAVTEAAGGLEVAFIGRNGITFRVGANIALEPRDRLAFDVDLATCVGARSRIELNALQLRAAGAALRCSQIAGAMESIAAMTIAYAAQRVQFGRPIAQFQAVQHNLAVLAEHTAAAASAADLAVDAFANGIAPASIAAAKSFAGEAAGVGARIAHQVHGAMGFSREYALHLRTRRLWSWREEYGNEAEWSAYLGKALLQGGADALWSGISAL